MLENLSYPQNRMDTFEKQNPWKKLPVRGVALCMLNQYMTVSDAATVRQTLCHS